MEEIPLWYWLSVFFAFGACVGSFYNVIVYRMPRGISLINPPSHCPLCKKHIPIRYNLPIVGWLWLRGKSACCHQPISVIYPIGEALCGLLGAIALFAAVAVVGGVPVSAAFFTAPVTEPAVWASAFAMFWLLLGAYPVCAVDCKYKLIPDSISVGGIVAGLLISMVGWCASKLLKKDAMGFGDVKLLAGYGALMGVTGAVETLIVAAILGIVVMVPYGKIAASRAGKKAGRQDEGDGSGQIPFGPFLAVAAPFMYLWGETLFNLYVAFVFGE